MILELTKNYNYPIVFNAPFGHIKDNRAVIFGKKVNLKSDTNKISLVY